MPNDPSNPDPNDLLARLQALPPEERAALLAQLGLPPAAFNVGPNAQTGDITTGDNAGGDIHKPTEGSVTLSDDARIDGVAVGVNLGTIIYGRDPSEDERRQLARYLARVAGKFRRLPLSGLAARLDDGDGVALEQVYIRLATNDDVVAARGTAAELAEYIEPDHNRDPRSWVKPAYDPALVLPGSAIGSIQILEAPDDPKHVTKYVLWRAALASEAVAQHARLVLLGDPGSGKSTFLRHLAWALAQRGLDQGGARTQLLGWNDDARLLPVFLPLRRLAGQIVREGSEPTVVTVALVREIEREFATRDAADLLDRALVNGTGLLMLDGLDEVPIDATPTSAGRLATLRVVRAFLDLYPTARVLITCRMRAFSAELQACLGWAAEQIAPFTLGQIRHFIHAWFATLHARGSLDQAKAQQYAEALTDAIVGNERLRRMAETPLLLTMMALVLVERGELPRDRPLLYEAVLHQLLGEWDVQKEGGQSLADVLGAPNLRGEDLRTILDRLSFTAHAAATSEDGRGRLPARDLRVTLTEYLETVRVPGAWEAAGRCLSYFNERSGLLLPEDDGSAYAFAHLTLQEHGAGRHLLLGANAVQAVMQRRADDRWREPIALGLGVVQRLYPMLADRIDRVFAELIDPDEHGRPKEPVRWYRDLILAAELGKERDWDLLRALINVDRLQRDLKKGLAALLNDPIQPLPTAERVRAGFLLGDLGDPRFPVTIEQWQTELACAGEPGSYFCRMEPGEYIIGSNDNDPDADDNEKPQHPFTLTHPLLIARYPITNAQWQAWVAQGGQLSYSADDPDHNRPNQAIVSISQHMSTAFCAWLTEHLAGALPSGYALRLPTEQEWEAAARGGAARCYPWGDDWRDDHAATEEDRETRGWRWNLPVGCYSAGAAPCGALDMAGNVWEWTASVWQSYPGAKEAFTDEDLRVLRGGDYRDRRTNVRCGARSRLHPDGVDVLSSYLGLRIVVAPPLAH